MMKSLFFSFLILCLNVHASVPEFGTWIEVKKGENKIGVLEIERDHPIDQSTFLYVKFALDYFKKEKVDFVFLKLDTPGGEVFSAVKIAQMLIKIDKEEHIPVVAFIDNWALSAGALLAYSCRFIGITGTANMGAAEPVIAGADGNMETASEKIISALRSEIANLAKIYGRNPLIAEAMVDKDLILVQRKGEILQLKSDEEIKKNDKIISLQGKLLSLNADELINYHIADFEASDLFQEPFFGSIPEKKFLTYDDWKIDFFSFLSHPAVSSLLLLGLILGIYLELSHPGFGVPGAFAVSCLALILLSSFAAEAIHWLELIILALGFLFLALEIFVIPGFGVVGIFGIVLTLWGLFALMLPSLEGIQWNLWFDIILYHLAWLSGSLLASIVLIACCMRYLPRQKFFLNRFVLQNDQEGYVPYTPDAALIGKEALALSDLKPSGHIFIEGKEYQAISQSQYIFKGAKVIIIASRSAYFIVKEFTDNACRN